MIFNVSSEPYKPKSSIIPYASMLFIAFGVTLLIFGGMISEATHNKTPAAAFVPVGIGLIILGGMFSKHAKRQDFERRINQQSANTLTSTSIGKRCARCNVVTRAGATFCSNCGQRL